MCKDEAGRTRIGGARRRSRIADILTQFRGLRQVADARSHQVRQKLSSVRNGRGEFQTDRQGVVDAFADFYEELYSSRREGVGLMPRVGL